MMALEEIRKQVMILHQAIMMLELQYRLEAIDILSDCCNDLRFKTLTYQDIAADHVLNLTMDQKEYIPFTGFEPAFPIGFPAPPEAHGQYDYGMFDYSEDPEGDVESVPLSEHQWPPPNQLFDEWESEPIQNDTSNPVNLVMPCKEEPVSKKSRRKQMFTRKSVQRKSVAGNSSEAAEPVPHDVPLQPVKDIPLQGPMSCRICKAELPDEKQFSQHKMKCKAIRPRVMFSCKPCDMKFRFQTHYHSHLAGHTLNDCRHCNKKFSSKNLYRQHLKKDHPDIKNENEVIPCKFCPMTFSRLKRLYNHYQLHHSKGKFVCNVCGIFLATKEKHKEHMTEHENNKKWTCDMCKKKFYWKYTLVKHVKLHSSLQYQCITCGITVTSKVELIGHKKKKHIVSGLPEQQFECDKCGKQFPKKWELERHLSSHSDIKMFGCKHCIKTFGTASALAKHQARNTHLIRAREVAPESKYEKIYQDELICEHCGKTYKTQSQLNNHSRIHKSTYMCDSCGATFSLKNNLRRHLKSHNLSVQAMCDLCGDSFARVEGLREHIRVKHAKPGVPPKHQCPKCLKKFQRKSELTRHLRIHESARPFVCFCGRSYKQSAHLRTHQKSAHYTAPPPPPLQAAPNTQNVPLLSSGHFDDMDYKLQQAVQNYSEGMEYVPVGFGEQPSVSPAVDLTMVNMAETGIKTEADSIPLVNLSERIVQEYLLNLP